MTQARRVETTLSSALEAVSREGDKHRQGKGRMAILFFLEQNKQFRFGTNIENVLKDEQKAK